jgi:hypothetical protein
MSSGANSEKYAIMSELNKISSELEQIASELQQFKGIGTEYCSRKLHHISNDYKNIRNRVSRI